MEEEGGKGQVFGVMVSIFPNNLYVQWSHVFLEMAEHLPASGSSELMSVFPLLACTAFALFKKLF